MPKKLDDELATLEARITTMGEKAQEMFQCALAVVLERKTDLLPRVQTLEDDLDRLQVEIDKAVISLIAVHGPVAVDLRFALMVARINTEIERVGDQALDMCENARLIASEPDTPVPAEIAEMADLATRMLRQSLVAFRKRSSALAREVVKDDDQVDALNRTTFHDLVETAEREERAARSLVPLLVARSVERIADHATNIAEEVVFLVQGEDIRHRDDSGTNGEVDAPAK